MQHTTMHYKTSVEFVQHFDEVEPTKMHEKEEKKVKMRMVRRMNGQKWIAYERTGQRRKKRKFPNKLSANNELEKV